MAGARLRIDLRGIEDPRRFEEKLQRAIFKTCQFWEGKIETHMRTTAPWTDRTGNARNGLFAKAVKEGDKVYHIVLRHSMHYGIYLEVCNDGRYAIVKPTLITHGPKVMASVEKLIDRVERRTGGA